MKSIFKIILVAFVLALAETFVFAADVLDIGTSARSIGMGRAYVGLAGGAENVFGNPAGLKALKKLELSSMYTNLSGDVTYALVGVGVPKLFGGNIGIGYASNNIADIYATSIDANGRATTLEPFTYGTNMLLGVYSSNITKDIEYGIRLKYVKKGGSISAVGEGSGTNLDIGLLYKLNTDATLGLVIENALSGGLGSIKWSNGVEEEMPQVINIGGKYFLRSFNTEIYSDLSFRKSSGYEIRIGGEWNAWRNLDFRVGIEQLNASPSEKYINYSLGLGYKLNNLRVDYAYYLDTLLTYNSRHYISIAINLPEGRGKYVDEPIVVDKGDRSVVTSESIELVGRVNRDVEKVVSGDNVADVREGEYKIKVKLVLGKNSINLTGLDSRGRVVGSCEARVLRTTWFRDLNRFNWVKDEVLYMTTLGIQGFTLREARSGFLRPNEGVSRKEMAVILSRAKDLPASKLRQPVAKDVGTLYWGAAYIKNAIDNNWLTLFNDGTFKPDRKINRAEAVAIVMRFAGIEPVSGTVDYIDVPAGYWAAGYISAAKKAGYLDYIKGDKFIPGGNLTRAEIFYLLSKTDYIKDKIKYLLDFEKGYK